MTLVVATMIDIFFFFQAEDGIRDVAVTGVQTCALPISITSTFLTWPKLSSSSGTSRRKRLEKALWTLPTASPVGPPNKPARIRFSKSTAVTGPLRSEERRVGKEGRSRWSPYH